jgi:hydroxypyruvate isomerase
MVRPADDAPRHTLKRFKPTVADVPGRCEPGTGEIHFPAVAAALDRLRYDGVVALEGWASGDPVDALYRLRGAFTVAG